MNRSGRIGIILGLAFLSGGVPVRAEDGYQLWLRYVPVGDMAQRTLNQNAYASLVIPGTSETDRILTSELQTGLKGLLGVEPLVVDRPQDGSLLVGTPASSSRIARLKWDKELSRLGPEGFLIRRAQVDGRRVTVIASQKPIGCLYGAFHLLRLIGTGQPLPKRGVSEKPRIRRRVLNHWDNLDGSIERGYAGLSLWQWDELPDQVDPRVADYARANASLGINGAVLNNVNANPRILTTDTLLKVKALADTLRPYGVRVYLSANFGAPKALGDLPTADPFDPAVKKWWKMKTAEIYRLIPDFGGFLVKANSEGQPGPLDYKRTHADGANMLADAVKPHGGIVVWRAFVYNSGVDYDRIKRAYLELMPQDKLFRPNVFLQAKNGPMDFQAREPFHPLFGGLKKTKVAAELQVTQEYFGHSTHLVYLATLWKDFLDSDTYAKGRGSLVQKAIDGSLFGHRDSLIAGVANTGLDRNWCGHPFAQANWYAYGRLAWNPSLEADEIAQEWILQTWGDDPKVFETAQRLMERSWTAFTDYMSPLGLVGVYEMDRHYAPDPGMVDPRHEDWSANYYSRADAAGLGFDRTRGGSGAVDQYHAPLPDKWNSLDTCPEELLAFFHHVPWNHRMKSGRTFWDELCLHYARGVEEARDMKKDWESLKGRVDAERYKVVKDKLNTQAKDAKAWRDICLKYFQKHSRQPIPKTP